MNARTVTCAMLVSLGWACAAAQAQQETPAPGVQPPPIQRDTGTAPNGPQPQGVPPDAGPWPGAEPAGPSGLSDWILYRRPGSGCCEPGPLKQLYSEAYLRVGPSVPLGGSYLGRELLVGWTIEGGVRALFFNREMTSAWVVDAGVVNSNNGALSPGTPVILNIAQPNPSFVAGLVTTPTTLMTKVPVTIVDYNRTMASLGFGKEWYIGAPADDPGPKWRIGFDGGGRYGSADMTFHEIRHRTWTIYATYIAVHTDYEIPCGCCSVAFGLRAEWSYTWDGILQMQTNLEDLNFLATFTVRY